MAKHKINPTLVKAGKVRVTFENEAGDKKVVFVFNHNEIKNDLTLQLISPTPEECESQKYEAYMYQALAYLASF
jgi:hypothetical protein